MNNSLNIILLTVTVIVSLVGVSCTHLALIRVLVLDDPLSVDDGLLEADCPEEGPQDF